MNEDLKIDIAKIIEDKSGKKLPSWLVGLIKRIIHEEEINSILERYGSYQGVDFINTLLKELDVTVRWRNPEALPSDARVLFVSNHPLGAIDGVGISKLLAERYGSIRFLVRDMLYYLKPLQSIFLPVSTEGIQKRQHVEQLGEVLSSDEPVGSFPAGYCSRYYDGKIQDRAWRQSIVSMAIKYRRDIVPLYFRGRNSKHFYCLDRVRRFLGVKFDICTALLPDEMFRSRGSRYEVVVGERISWRELADSGKKPIEIAEYVRSRCYLMEN